jgi:hypothetical protein
MHEALELEKGKSPIGDALDQDRSCSDRLSLCSPTDRNAGGILGGDFHARCDAINFRRDSHTIRRAHCRYRAWRIARSS